MIQKGDRVAVGVSGGKDSLTVLRLLDLFRIREGKFFDLIAIHISGDSEGPSNLIHPPLLEWFKNGNIPFIVEKFVLSKAEKLPMKCHRCSWNRKKQIFKAAGEHECNVVAFGHHADDFAQTTLMNLLFHGRYKSMAITSEYFNGNFRLIRPLYGIAEEDIINFAMEQNFPPPPTQCNQYEHSQRAVIRDFLEKVQKKHPIVRKNLIQFSLHKH